MSDSPAQSPNPAADAARLQAELTQQTALVQQVREELIRAQLVVLELQDTVLQKETDKADAVSILGRAELVLEDKINYIFELDRVLNLQIAGLKAELAAAQSDRDTANAALEALRAATTQDRAAREAIVQDLVQKLDHTHRELGAAHTLAGTYAREAGEAKTALADTRHRANELELQLGQSSRELAASRGENEALRARLNHAEQARTGLAAELDRLHHSFAWKLTAPLRALFGPRA